MLIEIRPDIFEDLKYFSGLKALLAICSYKNRYDFFVELSEVRKMPLYAQLDVYDTDVLEEFYNRSIERSWNPTHKISESETDSFGLDEAIRFLNQPLLIILENSDNDSHFVDALLRNFTKQSKKIRRHKENSWLKYAMGAGSSIKHVINPEMRTFDNLPKQNHKYLRCFVLIDSDKRFPTQALKKGLENLEKFLIQYEVPYHILEKREMENYLPEEVFDEIENNEDYIDAYKRLSSVQKDYFDIELGFPNKNFNSLQQEIQDLYHDLSENDKTIFRKQSLELDDFKNEFPKLFQSNKVTRGSLLRRCEHQNDPNELPNILEKITELL